MSTVLLTSVNNKGKDSYKDYYANNKKPGRNIIPKNLSRCKWIPSFTFCFRLALFTAWIPATFFSSTGSSVYVILCHSIVAHRASKFKVMDCSHVTARRAADGREKLAAPGAAAGICRYLRSAVFTKIFSLGWWFSHLSCHQSYCFSRIVTVYL